MFYKKELDFLIKTFGHLHLNTQLVDPDNTFNAELQMGMNDPIDKNRAENTFNDYFPKVKPCTIYRFSDSFTCRYIFMQLPGAAAKTVLFIGPYTAEEVSEEQILMNGEKNGLDLKHTHTLKKFYESIPVIEDQSPVFSMINAFAEVIWHSQNNFNEEDIESDFTAAFTVLKSVNGQSDSSDNSWNMHILEKRYEYENQLMDAVSKGQSHKAVLIFNSFASQAFESRLSDHVRNIKNYCIIINTLLRKAAENGGVHPIYLDKVSSDHAKRIEQIINPESAQELVQSKLNSYCRLVKNHNTENFSAPVKRAIVKIDSDLTCDLSLKTLSKFNNISAGYFSGLFKTETGMNLTDFVNHRRIDAAKHLLKNTDLQIQTVAQLCGVLDVNYFIKLFKKLSGSTPGRYRILQRPVSSP